MVVYNKIQRTSNSEFTFSVSQTTDNGQRTTDNRQMSNLIIFDPTVEPVSEGFALAPRPVQLEGKIVGLLDNGKHQSDKLLEKVGTLLTKEYGVRKLILVKKPSAYRPAPVEQLEELMKECQMAIAGIGD
jgi:hypothetical protein